MEIPPGGDILRKIKPVILLLAVAAILAVSCGEDPQTPVRKMEDDEILWPAMTDRDDVIKTIVLCYENPKSGESVSRYNRLLHSGYFFKFAAGDVEPGDPTIMDRAWDIRSTEGIFEYETMLELSIIPEVGQWYPYPEIGGEPCENCHSTERQYFIRAQFDGEGTISQSPVGRAFVTIIISPDESDSSKWVIRAMFDLVN
jgi:hypothetical protein